MNLMYLAWIRILSLFLCAGVLEAFLFHRSKLHIRSGVSALFSYKPTTYTAVAVPSNKNSPLLIKDSEPSLIAQANSFEHIEERERDLIDSWIQKGDAFWSDDVGIEALQIAEHSSRSTSVVKRKAKSWLAADLYMDCGDESAPIYVDRTKYNQLHKDGKLFAKGSGYTQDPSLIAELVRSGHAYTNVTQLFTAERVLHRADDIASRLKEEFPISSPEWSRWTNRTAEYNATSLTQVFGSYFAEQSIGDVGGKDYVPKAGYVGTLAPGENFIDNYGIDELPKKVLHPWPAMQQIQFHVRWPPSHPMIPPPLLWLALNNMYTENFTATQLSEQMARPDDQIIGGTFMEPRDALRIARGAKFGMSYDPAEQIPHGGMEFDAGYEIPHYHPDHPPTASAEDIKVDIPKELLPITERWMDPYYDLDSWNEGAGELQDEVELAEVQSEEERRRQVMESLLAGVPHDDAVRSSPRTVPSSTDPAYSAAEMLPWRRAEVEAQLALDTEVTERVMAHQEALVRERIEAEEDELRMLEKDVHGVGAGASAGSESASSFTSRAHDFAQKRVVTVNVNMNTASIDEVLVDRVETEEDMRARFRREIESARALTAASNGRARGKRQLIKYTIESMESLMNEIVNTERSASVKKPGRKRGKRSAGDDVAADGVLDPAEALLVPGEEGVFGGFGEDEGLREFSGGLGEPDSF